jgi:flagellar hook-associated protein 3 FlgL
MGQSQDQISRLKNLQLQLGALQTQVATGKKTQNFQGLGTDVMISKRARADFQKLDIYTQNIDRSSIRIKQMVTGIEGIQQQTNTAIDSIVNQTQKGDVELDFIRTIGENSFEFIVDALNLKDGDAYIYSGSDSSTQPIIDTGSLDSFYGDLNAQWSSGLLTINPPNTTIAQEYISRYRNIPDVTQGFSGSLASAKPVLVRADDSVELDYTVLANSQPMKDIISGITALKNIGDLDSAPGATEAEKRDNFFAVLNDISRFLTDAVDKLDRTRFDLSTVQANLKDIGDNHAAEKNVLLNTISGVENVDMNEVAVKVTALNTQLEASYQVTALVSQLSLANFI